MLKFLPCETASRTNMAHYIDSYHTHMDQSALWNSILEQTIPLKHFSFYIRFILYSKSKHMSVPRKETKVCTVQWMYCKYRYIWKFIKYLSYSETTATCLCLQEVKLFGTRVQHGMEVFEVCELAPKYFTYVSLIATQTQTCICKHMHRSTHTNTHTHIHTRARADTYLYTDTDMHMHTHTYTYTHTHMHTSMLTCAHTQTHTSSSVWTSTK